MNSLELEFRTDLTNTMSGLWNVTIHAENKYNPGVPDLSYVMKRENCETGWLELKATDCRKDGNYWFHVESGQHRWMENHAKNIPAHFLLSVPGMVYLLPGIYHRSLISAVSPGFLGDHGLGFQRDVMRPNLHEFLYRITFRGR